MPSSEIHTNLFGTCRCSRTILSTSEIVCYHNVFCDSGTANLSHQIQRVQLEWIVNIKKIKKTTEIHEFWNEFNR